MGFAGGYGVGSHDRSQAPRPPVASSPKTPSPTRRRRMRTRRAASGAPTRRLQQLTDRQTEGSAPVRADPDGFHGAKAGHDAGRRHRRRRTVGRRSGRLSGSLHARPARGSRSTDGLRPDAGNGSRSFTRPAPRPRHARRLRRSRTAFRHHAVAAGAVDDVAMCDRRHRRHPQRRDGASAAAARRRRPRRPARSRSIRGRLARRCSSTANWSGRRRCALPSVAAGDHAIRLELDGYRPLVLVRPHRRGREQPGHGVVGKIMSVTNWASRLCSQQGSASLNGSVMEAILALEDGTLVPRHGRRRRGRSARRGRVQHQHDRLSGSAHRSVVLRTDRDDDLSRDRQLRRVAGGRGIARAAGGRLHHPRRVAGGEQLARRKARCATISSPTTSSPSPTSTRARSRGCCARAA